MNIGDFISKVRDLRKIQKEYVKYPYPDLLRKKESLEKKIDGEINKYYEEKHAEEQMQLFISNYIRTITEII